MPRAHGNPTTSLICPQSHSTPLRTAWERARTPINAQRALRVALHDANAVGKNYCCQLLPATPVACGASTFCTATSNYGATWILRNAGLVRDRMPITFMYDPKDAAASAAAAAFMKKVTASGAVTAWIAKKTGGANGNDFVVSHNPEKILEGVHKVPTTDWWVLQEFIWNMPLLRDRRRFHYKIHIVMVATPVGIDLYAYKKQSIQTCAYPYDKSKPIDEQETQAYVTNWVQSRAGQELLARGLHGRRSAVL